MDYLLTACPKCLTHFGCQQHENLYREDRERFAFRVIDITQFLAESLAEESAEALAAERNEAEGAFSPSEAAPKGASP